MFAIETVNKDNLTAGFFSGKGGYNMQCLVVYLIFTKYFIDGAEAKKIVKQRSF